MHRKSRPRRVHRSNTATRATALAFTLALLGCGSKTALIVPRRPCEWPWGTGRATLPTGDSQFFVLDDLSIDSNDNPDVPHTGFNLDCLYSTDFEWEGCAHPDFFSVADDDQHCPSVRDGGVCTALEPGCRMASPGCRGGVDNVLPTIALTVMRVRPLDIRAQLSANVRRNRLAVIARVTEVPGGIDARNVFLYIGYPTFTSDCDRVLPSREYSIARASLALGRGTLDDAVFAYFGRVQHGRVSVDSGVDGTFAVPLDLSGRGDPTYTMLHRVRIAFDLASTELAHGNLGGWIDATECIRLLTEVGGSRAVAETLYGGISDLRENGICAGQVPVPTTIGRTSLGFGFHAVPATISGSAPIVDSPRAGTCGAQ